MDEQKKRSKIEKASSKVEIWYDLVAVLQCECVWLVSDKKAYLIFCIVCRIKAVALVYST